MFRTRSLLGSFEPLLRSVILFHQAFTDSFVGIFYFSFLAWAFPTNFLMQRFPIGKYLGINIFIWGFFLMLQAATKNFTQLAVLRAFSGAAEACSNPSFMLITSMWYTRCQQPVRIGIWYTANGLGIAGGGLLGYGIGHIKGSLPSWKYEFLIIGALCAIWGIVLFPFLPDSQSLLHSCPKRRGDGQWRD